jgi:hypothetical protein
LIVFAAAEHTPASHEHNVVYVLIVVGGGAPVHEINACYASIYCNLQFVSVMHHLHSLKRPEQIVAAAKVKRQ